MLITKEKIESFIDEIIETHNEIIKTSGGEYGIRDMGGLHHSAYKITEYIHKYSDTPEKFGAYIFSELARKHHFIDGNKRTAYIVSKITMLNLGYNFKIKYLNAIGFILKIAQHESKITFEEIVNWIKEKLERINESEMENYISEVLFELNNGK
jgi:death-on-curing protein